MASAVAVQSQMAGLVPAIRTFAFGLVALNAVSLPAAAQTDTASHDRLRDIHRTLVRVEEDLGAALRDKNLDRAKLANERLLRLLPSGKEQTLPPSSCSEAIESLVGLSVAVTFAVAPVTTGPLGSMNADGLRFSAQMRPAPEIVERWYSDYSTTYLSKMAACEQEAGVGASPRVLPTQLMQK